ncbi:hypothetical protein B0H10DRAFT_1950618 [Mycena sp. CBHHK59/15]|nr:hypothetical protein B0H10DRAFT_1961742 [Mycena sp. CBHHK59/15]KAJ6614487.1 hypothetical protein B0H10DRAFT_1950618 [Mycena sp. CBHHK59/15]
MENNGYTSVLSLSGDRTPSVSKRLDGAKGIAVLRDKWIRNGQSTSEIDEFLSVESMELVTKSRRCNRNDILEAVQDVPASQRVQPVTAVLGNGLRQISLGSSPSGIPQTQPNPSRQGAREVVWNTGWADLSLIWVMEFSPPFKRPGLGRIHRKSAQKVSEVSA